MKFNNLNGPTLTPLMEPPKQMQLVHVYKCNGFTLTAVMVAFTSRITTCVSMMSFFWSSPGRSSSTLSLAISSKSFRYIYFPLVLQSQGCSLLKLMASERSEDTKEGESGFLDACREPEPMKVSPNKNFASFGKIGDDFFQSLASRDCHEMVRLGYGKVSSWFLLLLCPISSHKIDRHWTLMS